jgi:hypothetical protein
MSKFGKISLLSEIITAVYARVGKMMRARMMNSLKVQGFRKSTIMSLLMRWYTKLFQVQSTAINRMNKNIFCVFQN